MSDLHHTLQGSYTYLVTIQILVVMGLVLSFVWLVMRRTRDAARETPLPDRETAVADVAAGDDELSRLTEVVRLLDLENARMKSLVDENRILRDKAKYLEAKLAEMEIAREERTVVVTLRAENERLKEELGRSRAAAALAPLAGADPVGPPADPKLLTLLS